jgi:hypothetical protein
LCSKGGDLIRYDPSDDEALAKIERVLLDPGYVTARESGLRVEYRPRTWAECVHAPIGKLDQSASAACDWCCDARILSLY